MLVDTGSDITILKIASLHDNVDVYSNKKLELNGISGRIITYGEANCHVSIGDTIIQYTIRIVLMTFQLQADGIIGIDLLNKLGATIDCVNKTIEILPIMTTHLNKFKLNTQHLNAEEKRVLLNMCANYTDLRRKPGQYLSLVSYTHLDVYKRQAAFCE